MAEINLSSVVSRVEAGFHNDWEMIYLETAKEYSDQVESEIELMLAVAFDIFGRLAKINVVIGDEFPKEKGIFITPQFEWKSYRIDFCIRYGKDFEHTLFIECDGHDFHERTKEQAERDRSRDREIQAAGINILRFTGREIWRNQSAVVVEIIEFMCR